MTKRSNNLLSEFSPVSRREWEERIQEDLKGADYKEKLKWNTIEGFEVLPFYRSDNLKNIPTAPLRLPGKWHYCEPVFEEKINEANELIKEAVKGGADSVAIFCRATPHSGALGGDITGTQLHSQKELSILFEDTDLSETHLFFDSGMTSPALVAMLQNHRSENQNASFLFDPFTYVAKHGRMPLADQDLSNIIQHLSRQPGFKALAADAFYFQQAGASIVQEIGIALSIGSEFLSRCSEQDKDKAAQSLFVRMAAGSLYFPEVAKIRALRMLWPQMLGAYGIEDQPPLWIHSETTQVNKTITDPYSNMLRATTEAMSAVLGGVNNLVIHPYDSQFQKPSAFSRRIARNVHHILYEEAGMGKVMDPAAGSYYLEILTDTIAKKGWEFFQLIEKQGGFLKALKNRVIHSAINESRSRKEEAYATQQKVLTGTNKFANPEENLPDSAYHSQYVSSLILSGETYAVKKEDLISSLKNAFVEGASIGDIIPGILSPQKVLYPAIEEFRAGRPFEQIRLKTRKHRVPVAVLVPVGDAKSKKARASFAQNVLSCAGFKIIHPPGFDSIEEASTELQNTDADLFVLCSSDKDYKEFVPSFCDTFSGNGKLLILAGNYKSEYSEKGIHYFIHSGMNLPEVLTELQQKIFKTEAADEKA
ncbi:MAG: methylmalonyl-CoA mutase family protein [Balneolaceae bacterium]